MNVFSVLHGWQCVEIQGPEARDFLQRMTTADFRFLKPGAHTMGTLLLPTGKVVLYFKAVCVASGKYLLLVPQHQAGLSASEYAHNELEKFHFREDFMIKALGDAQVYVRVLGSDQAYSPGDDLISINEARWNVSPIEQDLGLIVEKQHLASLKKDLACAGFIEAPDLEGFRLRAGDPAVPAEISPSIIPLEAEMDDAVHENKGCYPGQEVIERIRAMGQVPRRLAMVRGTCAPPTTPSKLLSAEQEAGTLTSVARDPFGPGWVGLGFIKRVFAKSDSSYTVEGRSVEVRFKGSG